MQNNTTTQTIYTNNRRATLNFASAISFGILVFTLVMIFKDYNSFVAEFKSPTEATIFTVIFILLSLALPITFCWISGRYVLRIDQLDDTTIRLTTWTLYFWHQRFTQPYAILQNSTLQPGQGFYGRGPVVNAPWEKVMTTNNKTLVIDLKANFLPGYPGVKTKPQSASASSKPKKSN